MTAGLLVVIMVLSLVACTGNGGEPSTLAVTFYDVGKADCILIQAEGHNILIDSGYDSTASTVLYELNHNNIEHLDALIITHYDKDHVGGAAYLVNNLEIDKVYLPGYEGSSKVYTKFIEAVDAKGISKAVVSSDISFDVGKTTLSIFASTIEYAGGGDSKEGNDNDCSLVIAANYGMSSFLFAGDIEKDGIKAFLAANRGNFDVIKMPHHGKLAKNTEELIAAVSPEIAVITDSSDEPADESVCNLLQQKNIQIFSSAEKGNITITTSGEGTYRTVTEK